jgi:hypothetical protein
VRAGVRWSFGKSNHLRHCTPKISFLHPERRKGIIGDTDAMRGGRPEHAQNCAPDLESNWTKTKITVILSSFGVYQRRKCTTILYYTSKQENVTGLFLVWPFFWPSGQVNKLRSSTYEATPNSM